MIPPIKQQIDPIYRECTLHTVLRVISKWVKAYEKVGVGSRDMLHLLKSVIRASTNFGMYEGPRTSLIDSSI